MSIIPLLICAFLITVKFFSIWILVGLNGIIYLSAVLTAVMGLLFARVVMREIIQHLIAANGKLERLNRQQAGFVSNVAHEFRTPLTIVKGALDNVADGLHGPLRSEQMEPLQMCQREINRLKRLVSDLLDLARIESGKMPMTRQSVVLQPLLESVARLASGPAKQRGLSLLVDAPQTPAIVTGDPDRLEQLFLNLVSNAIKFTPAGEIRMRLAENREGYRIEVIDTGRGISTQDLERIFDKFERVGNQEEEGAGLGLPIAKDIVELHRGRIWAESELGRGSRFIVQLPGPAANTSNREAVGQSGRRDSGSGV